MTRKSIYFIICILLLGSIHIATEAEELKKIITSVHFTVGYPAANNSSTSFFDVYHEELSGGTKNFSFMAIPAISVKIKYPKNFRFGIDGHYQYIDMRDYYEEKIDFGFKIGTRQIAQEFIIKTRAVFAIIEYMPKLNQFRTYIGAGLGANFGTILWNEEINSNIINDKRVGGIHYDRLDISPAFKIYSGIELGFDKVNVDDYLGSLFFEIMLVKLFRYENIFEDVYSQMDKPSEKLKESYGLTTNYIGFNIGVSFNVDIFKLNINE